MAIALILSAAAYWVTRTELDAAQEALLLERARTDRLAEDVKALHDQLVASRRIASGLRRELADVRRQLLDATAVKPKRDAPAR